VIAINIEHNVERTSAFVIITVSLDAVPDMFIISFNLPFTMAVWRNARRRPIQIDSNGYWVASKVRTDGSHPHGGFLVELAVSERASGVGSCDDRDNWA
jgi:hypothetical protein